MTVRYNQSGYVESNRSVRAVEAEVEGKLPLTRAIPVLAGSLGISRHSARELLVAMGPCEAHHTSKYANLTDYYDLAEAVREYNLRNDPLREEIELAEENETYGYDGWRWLGSPDSEYERLLNDIEEPYNLGLLTSSRIAAINVHHERIGCSIEHSANFRRWEVALRRLAG